MFVGEVLGVAFRKCRAQEVPAHCLARRAGHTGRFLLWHSCQPARRHTATPWPCQAHSNTWGPSSSECVQQRRRFSNRSVSWPATAFKRPAGVMARCPKPALSVRSLCSKTTLMSGGKPQAAARPLPAACSAGHPILPAAQAQLGAMHMLQDAGAVAGAELSC